MSRFREVVHTATTGYYKYEVYISLGVGVLGLLTNNDVVAMAGLVMSRIALTQPVEVPDGV